MKPGRPDLYLTGAELAALLRMHPDTLRKKLATLRAEGLPAPLGGALGRVWSRAAVEAWDRRRAGLGQPERPAGDGVAALDPRGFDIAAALGISTLQAEEEHHAEGLCSPTKSPGDREHDHVGQRMGGRADDEPY